MKIPNGATVEFIDNKTFYSWAIPEEYLREFTGKEFLKADIVNKFFQDKWCEMVFEGDVFPAPVKDDGFVVGARNNTIYFMKYGYGIYDIKYLRKITYIETKTKDVPQSVYRHAKIMRSANYSIPSYQENMEEGNAD